MNKRGMSGVVTTIILIGISLAVVGVVWYTINYVVQQASEDVESKSVGIAGILSGQSAPTSCLAILNAGYSVGDGVYSIDPDGEGGNSPFEVYCDMTTDGGGWTAVAVNGDNSTETCRLLHLGPSATGCGELTSSLTNDWNLDGSLQAPIQSSQVLFVAYDKEGYSNKGGYFAIDFGSKIPTPDSRSGGTSMTLPVSTTYGFITSTAYPPFTMYKSGTQCSNPFPSLTIFSQDSGVGTFSFYDADGKDGVDDFQDGCGCSDYWVPTQVRGWRAAILVR